MRLFPRLIWFWIVTTVGIVFELKSLLFARTASLSVCLFELDSIIIIVIIVGLITN